MTISRQYVRFEAASVEHPEFCELSYAQWNTFLDCVQSSTSAKPGRHVEVAFWDVLAPLKNINIIEKIKEGVETFKGVFQDVADEVGASIEDIILAFRSKDMFAVLRAVRFNIMKLFNAVKKFAQLYSSGLQSVFKQMHDAGWFDKLRSGAAAVDELLETYPILRKLAGPAIAGLLLYIWFNMSFIGNPAYDLDITYILAAVVGNFSIEELFASPSGVQMLSLLALNTATGLGAAYLGANLANFLLGLIYTGLKHLKVSPEVRKLLIEFKSKMKLRKFGAR